MVRVNRVGLALLAAALWASGPMQAQNLEQSGLRPAATDAASAPETAFQLRFLAPPQELQAPQTAARPVRPVAAPAERRKTLSGLAAEPAEPRAEASAVRTTTDLERAAAKAMYVSRAATETLATPPVPTRPIAWAAPVPAAAAPHPATWNPNPAVPPPSTWGPGSAAARTLANHTPLSPRPHSLPATSQPLPRPSGRPPATPRGPANPAAAPSGSWGHPMTATVPAANRGTIARPSTPTPPSLSTAPGWSPRPPVARGMQLPVLNPASPPVRRR